MYKKIIYILFLIFFITSCNTLDSLKRGMTGEKRLATDDFLIQKKDPLILPPDFESLPTPAERVAITEEISAFEKSLEIALEEESPSSSSVEDSILKKIKSR